MNYSLDNSYLAQEIPLKIPDVSQLHVDEDASFVTLCHNHPCWSKLLNKQGITNCDAVFQSAVDNVISSLSQYPHIEQYHFF